MKSNNLLNLPNNQQFKLSNFHRYTTNKPSKNGHCCLGTAVLTHYRFIHHQIKIQTISINNSIIPFQLGSSEHRLVANYKSSETPLQVANINTLLDILFNTIIVSNNKKHVPKKNIFFASV